MLTSLGFILTVIDIYLESLGRGLTKLDTKFREIATAAVDLSGMELDRRPEGILGKLVQFQKIQEP